MAAVTDVLFMKAMQALAASAVVTNQESNLKEFGGLVGVVFIVRTVVHCVERNHVPLSSL